MQSIKLDSSWNDDDQNVSEEDEEVVIQEEEQQYLTVELVLRIHAANLPRCGILKSLPDTYADVTMLCFRHSSAPVSPTEINRNETSWSETMISAISLDDESSTSLSDCQQNQVTRRLKKGRTEIIYKTTHPQYITTFPLVYEYGSKSIVCIDVYRLTNNKNYKPLLLGSAICDIGDVLGSKNRTKVKRLRLGGVVFCRLEAVPDNAAHTNEGTEQQARTLESPEQASSTSSASSLPVVSSSSYSTKRRFRFQFQATNLDFGRLRRERSPAALLRRKPDTIFQIQKRHRNASSQAWITVYRSSPVYEAIAPTWDEGEIDIWSLCNGDLAQPIRLSVWYYKKRGSNALVGLCETTVKAIIEGKELLPPMGNSQNHGSTSHFSFHLNRSVQKKKIVGRIHVIQAEILDADTDNTPGNLFDSTTARYIDMEEKQDIENQNELLQVDVANLPPPLTPPCPFADSMPKDACRLDLFVAIDFTSSNGDPRQPGSLHDQSSNTLNDYEETILALGNTLVNYCGSFSVWGFGAKFGGLTRHLFQCGSMSQIPSEVGVDGILRAYQSVFETDLIMSGPTSYDQVLQAAAVHARKQQCQGINVPLRYSVILIITDGLAQDMDETRRKLQVYSTVPLSVIFVGVGRADFADMYKLCEDIGNSTIRPNVTFVEFRRHQHDPFALGRAALRDLSIQINLYMEQNGITSTTSN